MPKRTDSDAMDLGDILTKEQIITDLRATNRWEAIDELINNLVTTGKIKPDSEAFEHAASALGCEPASILFLDDLPMNVHAAREAGLKAECVRGPGEAEAILLELGIIPSEP